MFFVMKFLVLFAVHVVSSSFVKQKLNMKWDEPNFRKRIKLPGLACCDVRKVVNGKWGEWSKGSPTKLGYDKPHWGYMRSPLRDQKHMFETVEVRHYRDTKQALPFLVISIKDTVETKLYGLKASRQDVIFHTDLPISGNIDGQYGEKYSEGALQIRKVLIPELNNTKNCKRAWLSLYCEDIRATRDPWRIIRVTIKAEHDHLNKKKLNREYKKNPEWYFRKLIQFGCEIHHHCTTNNILGFQRKKDLDQYWEKKWRELKLGEKTSEFSRSTGKEGEPDNIEKGYPMRGPSGPGYNPNVKAGEPDHAALDNVWEEKVDSSTTPGGPGFRRRSRWGKSQISPEGSPEPSAPSLIPEEEQNLPGASSSGHISIRDTPMNKSDWKHLKKAKKCQCQGCDTRFGGWIFSGRHRCGQCTKEMCKGCTLKKQFGNGTFANVCKDCVATINFTPGLRY